MKFYRVGKSYWQTVFSILPISVQKCGWCIKSDCVPWSFICFFYVNRIKTRGGGCRELLTSPWGGSCGGKKLTSVIVLWFTPNFNSIDGRLVEYYHNNLDEIGRAVVEIHIEIGSPSMFSNLPMSYLNMIHNVMTKCEWYEFKNQKYHSDSSKQHWNRIRTHGEPSEWIFAMGR